MLISFRKETHEARLPFREGWGGGLAQRARCL
ncbi:hypothetical protein RB2654_14185 [Rhodobacterales bacterium HTCC2654]|uniref:Uncharacterized protein n=1 Tax=Maritimibacter alkaliphilus HTCC2654 TaxID=314271 RepID=A3VGN6_9RHOB|nr:hypothetical protein RB2654_14185 [Rhodobacterales bacterium HTCC2654] [Maritimibacter alkaliphilus HTCC2654]